MKFLFNCFININLGLIHIRNLLLYKFINKIIPLLLVLVYIYINEVMKKIGVLLNLLILVFINFIL